MPPQTKTPEKIKSGFCGVGSCEGTKPRSASGRPMKTCEFWQTCSCNCHQLITKMFEMIDEPRILFENSEYVPIHSPYWSPSVEDVVRDRATPSSPTPIVAPAPIQRPVGDDVPPLVPHLYGPTITGRAARGELSDWINTTCAEWLVEKYPWPCTPVFIADNIAKREGIAAPSTGAIDAALKRWEELGYAVIDRKPTRFTRFTEDGQRMGLEALKERERRSKKKVKSNQAKGIRK